MIKVDALKVNDFILFQLRIFLKGLFRLDSVYYSSRFHNHRFYDILLCSSNSSCSDHNSLALHSFLGKGVINGFLYISAKTMQIFVVSFDIIISFLLFLSKSFLNFRNSHSCPLENSTIDVSIRVDLSSSGQIDPNRPVNLHRSLIVT